MDAPGKLESLTKGVCDLLVPVLGTEHGAVRWADLRDLDDAATRAALQALQTKAMGVEGAALTELRG